VLRFQNKTCFYIIWRLSKSCVIFNDYFFWLIFQIWRLFENISKCEIKIPNEIDELLKTLIQGMLHKCPEERSTLEEIKYHDWVKKKHPRISPNVRIPQKAGGDEFRSMSVLPYLCDLHNRDYNTSDGLFLNDSQYECKIRRKTCIKKILGHLAFWKHWF
jgi:serine/threonine protein kinase